MSNARETREARTFGASLFITRTKKGEPGVLLIDDVSKTEVSGGISTRHGWFEGRRSVKALPAGGRGTNAHGLPETLRQNLTSELQEEVNDDGLKLPVKNTSRGDIQKQVYPLAVAQLAPQRINHFASQTLYVPFDYFDSYTRVVLDERVKEGLAAWYSLQELGAVFAALSEGKNGVMIPFRPQTIAIAQLYYLSQIIEMDAEDVSARIKAWNGELNQFIDNEALSRGIPIKNGAYDDEGRILEDKLNARDRKYLFQYP